MVNFSNDTDILKYEPILFGELHLSNQILLQGNDGTVSGTTFTAGSADFINASVAAGGVIYLQSDDGEVDGVFEIVSVNSATQLTVSVVRADSSDSAVALPNASNVFYRICSYAPQAKEAEFHLTEYFGIAPGNPSSDIDSEDILDTAVLKRASVFAVISCIYAILASKTEDEIFWQKSLYYRKMFEKARQRCRLSIDAGGDGISDITKLGSSVRLVRD